MTDSTILDAVNAFTTSWTETDTRMKEAFLSLKDYLDAKEGVTLDFHSRPGVSYSLRACHAAQTERDLFVMVDVIDDDPDERWLSVCFYGDMITDPDEEGDLIPDGLKGSDGYCFDMDEFDADKVAYLKARFDEACANAS
ncbi:hypothetical protein [Desulfoluna spongiiphila]|uniref:Uncharacterized protein n=1 Tax=Desulfoluna spongiiphila TaxID=419481 RepID=A0A1G5JER5_9BACT|nr:hypothetical protein [Desulfoluna spongiiphila]SCY86835.1 hypothetical protein SAMN05216233_12949 [Desulfoluna spongiiphila]VVS93123.1 hypothetical protein DBB_26910 [Desulfoluna spongiiphila]